MFVTCLYAILDPESGLLRYANAGHDLPYRRQAGRRGRRGAQGDGDALGLLPGMGYEEKEIVLERGESVLFYSDGLVEAHDPQQRDVRLPAAAGPRRHPPLGRSGADRLPAR